MVRLVALAGFVSMLLLVAADAAAASFNIADITPSGWTSATGYALNASGRATGWGTNSAGGTRGFFFNGTTSVDLGGVTGSPPDAGTYSTLVRGLAINSNAEIAGYGISPAKGFIYSGGTLTQLPYLTGGSTAQADAINNVGEIGGVSNGPGYNHATIWKNGVAYDLAAASGSSWTTTNTNIAALNNTGKAIGNLYPNANIPFYSSYSIAGGVLTCTTTDLYATLKLSYPTTLSATAISDNNQIVGSLADTAGSHAYLYTIGGSKVDLPLLGSGTQASAQGVNQSGWVVGWSYTDAANTTKHAFLYHDGVMADLNDMINPASGWTLTSAQGVTDTGHVVGTGTINGQTHAFALSAFPGDANLDGKVDVTDLNRVLTNYDRGSGMTWSQGDFSGTGSVGVLDLNIVLTNYNKTVGFQAGAVPEPSCLALLTSLLLGAALVRPKRK